eukprot:CAMPEP_0174885852 /NCGR_PEP_ID=MMETSP0167-20121228/1124_1 /TAXON_ID=38298 /ORGANISM="Rhodella maculata, Strain CCMP736" /LENGTH=55 /DNA_ID=CAMNT_0016121587 /DNA_START=24 /DNA_END=191 /DNA_ORIENTATION=+
MSNAEALRVVLQKQGLDEVQYDSTSSESETEEENPDHDCFGEQGEDELDPVFMAL